MEYEITKSRVLSSLFWRLMERGGTQGIQFILTIVLARLLLPKEFGLIVLATIFITIAGVFVQSGFNTALIQKKETDGVDFSSVFFLSLFIACILYLVLFFTAPLIATFFDQPDFKNVLRVLAFTLFLGSINSIQIAVITRKMQFKKLFVSSLGAITISGSIGVILAYESFGIWALVGQQLMNQLMVTIILWFTVKWRPQLTFSMKRIQSLFSFGWKLLLSGLLDTIYTHLRSLIVGKMFNPATLGFYNRGEQFPNLIVSNIDGSIQSVMLPTISSFQDDKHKVKEIVRRSIVTSSFLIFPLMVGMAVIAEPLVTLLLTEKWLPTVPFLQIFCASYALWPIHTANLQVMNALGRSDLFLKLEIIKKILGLVILAISISFGIYAMAWGVFVTSVLSTFINIYPNISLINYRLQEQWKDIIPSLLLSLAMGVVVYTIHFFEMNAIITIIIQVSVGILFYVGFARAFKLECFTYLLLTLKEILKSKRKQTLSTKDGVHQMKKLLMLGGAHAQVPAIIAAREMGHYVIICDYLEDNPGRKYAHEYYNISTTDKEAVLTLAKSLKIDGIVCYATDPAAPTAAYVGEKLGLPSQPYKSVEILSNKDKFREFLKENNFNVPRAKGYSSYEEAKGEFHQFKMPVMIKPVDSSGSKGVSKIDSIDLLQEKVEHALSFSRVKRFVMEEYIESCGYHITGDGFSVNGELVFRSFANTNFSSSKLCPFVPVGSSWPYIMPERIHNKIHDEIQRVLNLLNMKTGAYDFDIRIDDKENVYFIEIGARVGGEWVAQTIKYATQIDLIEYTIKAALGEDCSDLTMAETKGYWGMYVLNSQKNGIFKEIDVHEMFKKNNIVEYELVVKPGNQMLENKKVGIMILKFSSETEMLEKMENMSNWVKVIIEESFVKNS